VFIAVAIGYGFEEDRGQALALTQLLPPFKLGDVTLNQIPADALITGLRVNPRFTPLAFVTEAPGIREPERNIRLTDQLLPAEFGSQILEKVKSPEEISFLFSMVDTGSGRELQDQPTHNLASLGSVDGRRPFRLLAQPLTFLPRSTLRLQIVERSESVQGTLFIVLYGYKLLGAAGCPEPVTRSLRGPPACPTETIGRPSARVIPFDYVASFQLTGRPANLIEDEVPINVEGGFVATALGYGLAAEEQNAPFVSPAVLAEAGGNVGGTPAPGTIDLGKVRLRRFPTTALSDGIRIRPDFVRLAFQNNGQLASALPVALGDQVFERLNRPEDVSFRYAILDTGSGRELQNQPINNIAGLGIANGDRPFKKLARPMVLRPRSTIRVTVEERFGRGRLFLVFQGYKFLGGMSPGGLRP
jgi:hypothetical protein